MRRSMVPVSMPAPRLALLGRRGRLLNTLRILFRRARRQHRWTEGRRLLDIGFVRKGGRMEVRFYFAPEQ